MMYLKDSIFKVCNGCNERKSSEYFSKGKGEFNLKHTCKICDKKASKTRTDRLKNQEKINVDSIICFKCKEEKSTNFFDKNKCSLNGYQSSCKQCRKIARDENKEGLSVANRKWREDNKEYKAQKDKEYRLNNKEKINAIKRKYEANKRKINPLFKLSCSIRRNIKYILTSSNIDTNYNTLDILGCSMEDFKKHIESQFLKWMSWDNYGNACETLEYNCSWDLDHIIPISSAKTEEEVYLLNHWSNFQPLCSKVNRWEKKDNLYPVYNLELNIENNNRK